MKALLKERLEAIDDVHVATWKDTELLCVFYRGRDFAHFHGDDILDIRLSPKIIREAQLTRSVSARIHPNRSRNSRWIGIEFKTEEEVDRLIGLVRRACGELG
ncbi:MAG: luciferase family protein [Pseudomonadota bacterium]